MQAKAVLPTRTRPTNNRMESCEPAIARLPCELLAAILWDARLTREDVEAVRLTGRCLGPVATTRLFYRIRISKLRTDRDRFLSICRSPHLAMHVREVEWLEIRWDEDLCRRIGTDFDNDDGSVLNLDQDVHIPLQAEFWLLNTPPVADTACAEAVESLRREAVAEFTGTFQTAIDSLTRLHTFISRPMSCRRTISRSGYPIEAGLLQTHQGGTCHVGAQANDGLLLFLLPCMDRPTSTVTRLRWADESPGGASPGRSRILPWNASSGWICA